MVIETRGLVDAKHGTIDRRLYTSEELYQQELENIFGWAWLFIGHESLIPNPNDFYLTYMGEDPVILTRDGQGKLHAFLNMCMHRGNRVVRADDGNAKNFMCTYHGWTYSNDGKLASVPGLQEAYYGELDVDNLGLVSVAQLDTYAGFIFATWDPEAPGLEEYLGDMRWYMDTYYNRRAGGVKLIGPSKWQGYHNWKPPADNFSGDGYHIPITHRSATLATASVRGVPPQPVSYNQPGYGGAPGNGHGHLVRVAPDEASARGTGTPALNIHPVIKAYNESIRPEMEERLGAFRGRRLQPIVGNVFPNMSFLWINGTVRLWLPRGPHMTEIWAWVVYDVEAPDDVWDVWRQQSILTFGPSGMFEQDDMDNWNQVTKAGNSRIGGRSRIQIGMGIGHETMHDDMPGLVQTPSTNELPMRALYERWQEFIDAKSWKDIRIDPITFKQEGTATFKG